MTIAAFPNTATVGALYSKYLKHPADYDDVTIVQKMEDGGADYLVTSPGVPQIWELLFDGMDETQAKVLDDHYALALGQVQDFSFTEPRNVPFTTTGGTFTGVHYLSYQKDHDKYFIQSRKITLIKRPI